jgi:hypothetical protein
MTTLTTPQIVWLTVADVLIMAIAYGAFGAWLEKDGDILDLAMSLLMMGLAASAFIVF